MENAAADDKGLLGLLLLERHSGQNFCFNGQKINFQLFWVRVALRLA